MLLRHYLLSLFVSSLVSKFTALKYFQEANKMDKDDDQDMDDFEFGDNEEGVGYRYVNLYA